VALALSLAIRRFLKVSKSDKGVAKIYYPLILTPSLLGGALYWIIEWADTTSVLGEEWDGLLRLTRTWVARFSFGWVLILGGGLWYVVPLCVDISVKKENGQKQVQIIGFANASGSPYLLFWTVALSIIHITSQLPAQVVLSLATIALLSYLEVLDSVRDVEAMERAFANATPSAVLESSSALAGGYGLPFRFNDIVPLALLGLHAFYGTGHQSTISSIQWKAAFMLTSTVTYPWSAITIVVNSIGPIFLFGLAAPLLGLWNRTPEFGSPISTEEKAETENSSEPKSASSQAKTDAMLAGLAIMSYYATLLLGTSISAAVLRRHLMVWKVFAPRFMAAVLGLLAVDLGVLLGAGVGVARVTQQVRWIFRGQPPAAGSEFKEKTH
jgi:phosphatidylinositol glycan class O